ncbi:MAG: RnfABCDGE type electron transport complex subunit D [Deltaproteobacteria bacterium]|nr:RnfABCDGE type electron transport complex subunit D [Deltaproteobacteria bacterium]
MLWARAAWPEKLIQPQKAMHQVVYAMLPLEALAIYLFGWRSLVMLLVIGVGGFVTEAAFNFPQKKPVTAAVFVSALILHLSLPPTTPLWMAALGSVAGIGLGKMVFGGFGMNVFNPAMVGRCFLYINFPTALNNQWVNPFSEGLAGLTHWFPPADAVTSATPLAAFKAGAGVYWSDLLLGRISGSLGETSALLIVVCGLYIVYKKSANWRLVVACLLGGAGLSLLFSGLGFPQVAPPVYTLLSGAFMFGAFFVVTEPISGPKTQPGMWIYGLMVGGLTVVLRAWSNFAEGFMFSIILANAFAALLDQGVRRVKEARKVKA